MSIKIAHTADIHIKEFEDIRWQALEEILRVCKKEKVDILAVSGDLFEHDAGADKLRPQIRNLFSGNPFKIILLPGNHDRDSYVQGLDYGSDVHVIKKDKPFIYKNITFYGLPFMDISQDEVLKQISQISAKLDRKQVNILLYHGELLDTFFSGDDFGEEGNKRYMPVKLSYFDGLGWSYILAGHFHTNFQTRQIDDKTYFVYPGSPVSITKKETGFRKINLFKVGQKAQEYVLNTKYFENININFKPEDKKPIKIIKSKIKNINNNAIALLNLTGYLDMVSLNLSEKKFAKKIKKVLKNNILLETNQVRDISEIWNSKLFKNFLSKLNKNKKIKNKQEIKDLVIKAMMK